MQSTESFSQPSSLRFEAIGTTWEIQTTLPLPAWLQQRIRNRIEAFDRTYSRFRTDSLVSRIALASDGGRFTFPGDCRPIFGLYDELNRLTDGAVDPLVGRRLEQLGYDRQYSLQPLVDPLEPDWGQPRWQTDTLREDTTLLTRGPLVIDIGAAGKGYLVDIVADLLIEADVDTFLIDAGGDIRQQGQVAVRIGLEDPLQPGHVIGTVDLCNAAICASAVNRRVWGEGLHHILDARWGQPVRDVVASWVVANDALTADGLATALFFIGADQLADRFAFSSVRMFANRTVEVSENFTGELFFRSII